MIPWTPGGEHRHERSRPKYRSDAGKSALRAKNPLRRSCRSPAVRGKRRCRMHGGAPGSGAPRANQNARQHGRFTSDAIAGRKQIEALLGEARKLLQEMNDLCSQSRTGWQLPNLREGEHLAKSPTKVIYRSAVTGKNCNTAIR